MVSVVDRFRLNPDRLRRALAQQGREWGSAVLSSGAFGAAIAAGWGVVAVAVRGRTVDAVADDIGRALAWFVATWILASGLFVLRALAVATNDNLASAHESARRWTLVAAGAAMTLLVFALTSVGARAEELSTARPATPAGAGGTPDYCARDLGTWFYCARPEEAEPQAVSPAKPAGEDPAKAIADFDKFKADLEKAQKVAVWDPTPENVERFYRMQRAALNQSSLFSDQYRRLIWARPDLDYTLKRPVSELGKRQWSDQRSSDREMFLQKVSPDIGLFYVYRGTCGPCRVFSPIMKSFADRYAVTVKGISTDGAANAYIPSSFPDRGQLHAWGFDNPTTPSVLLYQSSSLDPRTGAVRETKVRLSDDRVVKVQPCLKPQGCLSYLAAGVMAQDDIAERIYVLLATELGEDY
ncbi:MAG: hypothetical protein B7Z26_06380 [Asticcacaulis sp. 32-58-5]|nr:MAG: hypothetical protein B7Z26_06380 [Asticcacaulis sp. 32-58-5]